MDNPLPSWAPLNWALLSNPVNWAIIVLMMIIGTIIVLVIAGGIGVAGATKGT